MEIQIRELFDMVAEFDDLRMNLRKEFDKVIKGLIDFDTPIKIKLDRRIHHDGCGFDIMEITSNKKAFFSGYTTHSAKPVDNYWLNHLEIDAFYNLVHILKTKRYKVLTD